MDPSIAKAISEVLGPFLGLLALGAIPVTLMFLTNHFKLRTRELELEAELHGRDSQARLQAKELFDVKGFPTTAGTRLLAQAIAEQDAFAVRRLDQAGMVLLGKNNTVQFAYGGVGINNDHGTPHNPWHPVPHVPGGSSSGTAVAVAAGLAPARLGTDTGGSVRIPAALCGIVGLKTTVGRVSRAGVYPLSYSPDTVGVLARSVEDAALVHQQLAGPDDADETTLGVPPDDALAQLRAGVKGLRLAFVEAPFFDGVDRDIAQAVHEAGRVLEGLGAQVGSLSFPEAAH